MSRTLSEKVGRGRCLSVIDEKGNVCDQPVTYRRSAGGYLTHKCEACDSTGYAEPGGNSYKARMATIQPSVTNEPAPATEPPKPKKRADFSLESLT